MDEPEAGEEKEEPDGVVSGIPVTEEVVSVPQEENRGKTEQRASKRPKILRVDFIEAFLSYMVWFGIG